MLICNVFFQNLCKQICTHCSKDMESEGIKLNECSNCGFNYYELIAGHYYCTECHQQHSNIVAKEHDEFAQGDTQKSTIKVKAKVEKNSEDLFNKITSFEEYNYILHGLTNEILEIEQIPNFRVTVLQLWISYLKTMEIAFFDDTNLAHLPKLFIHHRETDAEILYNKKPKPKYKPTYKKKLKTGTTDVETVRRKKRKIRKGMTALDTSESSFGTKQSSLSSMSLDEISIHRETQELNIEYSGITKEIRRKVINYKEKHNEEVKFDENGDILVTYRDLRNLRSIAYLLDEKTLIYILYCALNICQSQIQLVDLLRMAREGHISFFNFIKHIPEHLTEQLSLRKGHTFSINKYSSVQLQLPVFISLIPDLKTSLKVPNIPQLVRRYLKDLSLPDDLGDYIERLINFMPPLNMKSDYSKYLPNFEGRAVAYIIFVLKILFGIDGYREVEISKAAAKLNKKLEKHNIESSVFVYEEWRKFIAYRDIILSKYYAPYLVSEQYDGEKPYESFLGMLDQAQPDILPEKKSHHNVERKRNEKYENTTKLAQKLLALHDEEEEKERTLFSNQFSLTPLYNAMKAISYCKLSSKLNQKIIERDHRRLSCEVFLKPQLIQNCVPFNIKVKKCTFPKVFCFKKDNPKGKSLKFFKIVHEKVNEKVWRNDLKEQEEIKKQKNREYHQKYHQKKYTELLLLRQEMKKRVRQKLKWRQMTRFHKEHHELNIFDEIFDEECPVKEEDSVDEIADLNELESIFSNVSADKFNYDKNQRVSTFVVPDFNLWHRQIKVTSITKVHADDLAKLPRSFRWLIAAASNIIHQNDLEVYQQLFIIEREFIRNVGPVELLDAQPRGVSSFW